MKTLTIGDLKARIPIIQGGMGVGISLSGLASAVANEGGIGVISAAGLGLLYKKLSPNYTEAGNLGLAAEIRKAREKAKGIIGVNVMVALSDFAELVKTSIAEKVDIIFSGAGLPLDLPSFLKKDSVTKLVPIVSSARAVRIICEKWKNNYDYLPDAVVLEGPKAGGHLGYKENQLEDEHFSLEELLPQVVEEVSHFEEKYNKRIPVIAAGGIYTGEDIKRVMDLSIGRSVRNPFRHHYRVRRFRCFQGKLRQGTGEGYRDHQKSGRNAGQGNPQSFSRKGKSRDETAEGLSFQLHQDMRYLAKPLLYRNSPVQRLQRELRERLRFRRKQCLADNPHHVGERNDKRADQRVETL